MLIRLIVRTIVITAAAGIAMAQTSGTTITRSSSSLPVGLASSETAQVNVVNRATASSSGTAASCTGSISFVNSSGAAIGSATSFTVASGQIFSASLPFARVGATGARTEIRGVITLTQTTGSGAPCSLASSMEVYDTGSGVTHLFIGNATNGDYGGGGGPGPGR